LPAWGRRTGYGHLPGDVVVGDLDGYRVWRHGWNVEFSNFKVFFFFFEDQLAFWSWFIGRRHFIVNGTGFSPSPPDLPRMTGRPKTQRTFFPSNPPSNTAGAWLDRDKRIM
jgi:hypothetical protein